MKLDKLKTAFDSFLDTKVAKLSGPQLAGIWIGILAVPLIAYYFLFISPKTEEIQGLEKKHHALEKKINDLEKVAKNLEKFEKDWKEAERLYRAASRLLPDKKDIPFLLTYLSGLGLNSGLDFRSFKPLPPRDKEFYQEIPISIQISGPYHNLVSFMDKISKSERFATVSSNVTLKPSKGPVSGEMIISTSLEVITYMFKEPAPEKGKADAKKKKRKKK